MWELFTHPSNLIFSICLSLMFLLGLLELILLVLGGGSQGLLDQFLPDDLGSTKDVDIALDVDQGWLNALAGLVVYRPCSSLGLADYLPHPV